MWAICIFFKQEHHSWTRYPSGFTCHSENANNPVDFPISQEQRFLGVSTAVIGFLGLPGGKQSNSQNQDVEENHHDNARHIQSHGERWKRK